jgi:hypothetical protein
LLFRLKQKLPQDEDFFFVGYGCCCGRARSGGIEESEFKRKQRRPKRPLKRREWKRRRKQGRLRRRKQGRLRRKLRRSGRWSC